MNSILQEKRECYFTHYTQNLEYHHVMNGNKILRKKSEKYGLWVWLASDVHRYIHSADGTEKRLWLKQKAQKAFEERYGHDLWMREFHKNYL